MPAGLEIFNTSNTIVIDENYQNFMLSATGSVTTVAQDAGILGTTYTATVQAAGKNPQILFTNTGSRYVGVAQGTTSGNITSFLVVSDGVGTFNYMVFCTDVLPSSGNYGLQVFNANGELAFDSSNKLLRIESVIQTVGGETSSYSISDAGKTIAAALSFSRFSLDQIADNPFPILARFMDVVQINSGVLRIKRVILASFPGQPDQSYPPQNAVPAQLIVANVTGYS